MYRKYFNIFIVLMIGLVFSIGSCSAGNSDETESSSKSSKVNWVSYDEGLKLAAKENKVIFVDFYTTWCKFCVKMDKETFARRDVADYMNEKIIAVKINAESNTKIKLSNGEFSGRELAKSFGVKGFPTYWFLKSDGEKINYFSGYRPADVFIDIVKYVGDGHYATKTMQEYTEEVHPSN